MKLHFEPNLDYQLQAVEAVCDLFRGQEVCRTEFTVSHRAGPDDKKKLQDGKTAEQMMLGGTATEHGYGNRLSLVDAELLKNLHAVQLRNGLAPSPELASGDFTVEMETGTGKTYVYLRTIFELNKRYGFTKFAVVVPSIAIKEGVFKSLQITEDHFKGLYAGVAFEYFIYDSAKLGQVRNFATSQNIQIMVLTVGAISRFGDETAAEAEEADETRRREKSRNVMYRPSEKVGGEKPIDLIRQVHPVLIVDEPQSVDGGLDGKGRQALQRMQPLCTLRYSATHRDEHHMVFSLDAVDAYERKLVKQIEVAAATLQDAYNRPYVRLLSISNRRRQGISARVELDVQEAGNVRRRELEVQDGEDLQMTTGRSVYQDCRIGQIGAARGREYVELRVPGGEHILQLGQAYGDVEAEAVHRQMIRRTIQEHLEKEMVLRPRGIKVLSLFFIDEVAKYRQYDADGNPRQGVYARIFEEEYQRAARLPDFNTLFQGADLSNAVRDVHDGYFSIDRKGGWADTGESNAGDRENAERAYNLIMKDKEKLLSFETPLKFIFSHSALREGWDNPNVFQICTLRDIRTERERRQTIGRGLRLCVDQAGQRVHGFETNRLTVIATESYEDFANNLQREIEEDTGIRFGVVQSHQFAGIPVVGKDGQPAQLGFEQSEALWNQLHTTGYLDANGKVKDVLRQALKDGKVEIPAAFAEQQEQIVQILKKAAGKLEIKNADERRAIRPCKRVLASPEFKELWDRIKHKTTYRVQFDNAKLIAACIEAMRGLPAIPKTRLVWNRADIAIGEGGVVATEKEGGQTVVIEEENSELPDLLTDLQDKTQLTRRSICRILIESGRLNDFKRNPQAFIELAAEAINRCKRLVLVAGIKYQRIGDEVYYAQELFEMEELSGYLKNLRGAQKSVYDQIVCDSDTERDFAAELERNQEVKVYAKLPGWFKVPTPLGSYNPDWAVLIEKDGSERLYFVVETKGGLFADDLRLKEHAKIECGKAHFKALAVGGNPACYVVARRLGDVFDSVEGRNKIASQDFQFTITGHLKPTKDIQEK